MKTVQGGKYWSEQSRDNRTRPTHFWKFDCYQTYNKSQWTILERNKQIKSKYCKPVSIRFYQLSSVIVAISLISTAILSPVYLSLWKLSRNFFYCPRNFDNFPFFHFCRVNFIFYFKIKSLFFTIKCGPSNKSKIICRRKETWFHFTPTESSTLNINERSLFPRNQNLFLNHA